MFRGESFISSPKRFVEAVMSHSPELKRLYEDAPELSFKYSEKSKTPGKEQKLWFSLAFRMCRELSKQGWNIQILPVDDSREDNDGDDVPPEGDERWAFSKERVNQSAFRNEILGAYDNKCCITGIDIKELLVASHIKPWSKSDKKEKTDPRNGLCLNALHDRAFDRGLIAISDKYTVVVSKKLALYQNKDNKAMLQMLLAYEAMKIELPPDHSRPLIDLLAWHRKYYGYE